MSSYQRRGSVLSRIAPPSDVDRPLEDTGVEPVSLDLPKEAEETAISLPRPSLRTFGNLDRPVSKDGRVQLNLKLDPDVHYQIKMSALKARMKLNAYVQACHVAYQEKYNPAV